MRRITITIGIILAAAVGYAQLVPVDDASTVRFTIKNIGVGVDGSFKGLAGTIVFDPQHPANSGFNVTVDANTLNTGNSMRDDHLKRETYFDVAHYKTLHFVSTKVSSTTRKGVYFIFGKLTIKNVTKDISFLFTSVAQDNGYAFKGSFKINRRDFGVGGASVISDELQVFLNIVAK